MVPTMIANIIASTTPVQNIFQRSFIFIYILNLYLIYICICIYITSDDDLLLPIFVEQVNNNTDSIIMYIWLIFTVQKPIISLYLSIIITNIQYHQFQAYNNKHMLLILLILTIIPDNVCQAPPANPSIYFNYYDVNQIRNNVTIYQNSTLNYQFEDIDSQFSCGNGFLFTYNQTELQYLANIPYNLSFVGFDNNFTVSITTKYHFIDPQPNMTYCSENFPCNILVTNNCPSDAGNDLVQVNVQMGNSKQIIHFVFNVICDVDKLQSPIEWGKIGLALISVVMIFIPSRYQTAKAFNNWAHYINQYTIVTYNLFVLVSSVLVIINVRGTNATISYICLLLSVMLGIAGIMVCLSQFCYWLNIKCFRYGVWKVRVMDCIGIGLGVCILASWFILDKNWIVGNFIYCFIFVATLKLVKFGSLKMATITFVVTMSIDVFFIGLAWGINKIYYNNAILSIFNNPLFLMVPTISHYPNRKCSWFFLASMLFPGLLQCYFQRFDSNRSSKIYTIIFFNCYVVTMIVWIIINFYADFTFPYDLLVTPATLVIVVLFANRRGQINQIWLGQFYDQVCKNANMKQRQLRQVIKKQKSPSQMSYSRDLFQGLKYGDLNDTASIYERGSNLTDVQPWKLSLKQQQQLQQIITRGKSIQKEQKTTKQSLLQKIVPKHKNSKQFIQANQNIQKIEQVSQKNQQSWKQSKQFTQSKQSKQLTQSKQQ